VGRYRCTRLTDKKLQEVKEYMVETMGFDPDAVPFSAIIGYLHKFWKDRAELGQNGP